MPVTVVQDKGGATVVTIASGLYSVLLPLCQTLSGLCYGPVCRSVQEGLMQPTAILALGAVQIMVGLFNIGLGAAHADDMASTLASVGAGFWLGVVFLAAGALSVVAYRLPSICLVGVAVFMNVVASIVAIVAIVLYAVHLGRVNMSWRCDAVTTNYNCYYLAARAQNLLTAMDITLIILAVLQLCVSITVAVLCSKALLRTTREHVHRDVDILKPLLIKEIDPDV